MKYFCHNEDPDEMLHFVAFHLGVHCLQKYPFRGFQYTKGSGSMSLYYLWRGMKKVKFYTGPGLSKCP